MPLLASPMPTAPRPGWEVTRRRLPGVPAHMLNGRRPPPVRYRPPSDKEPDAHREDADDDVEEGANTSADQAGLCHPLPPGARVRLADSLDPEHDRQHNLGQREQAPPAEHDAGDAQDHAGQRQAVLCLRWDLGIARCVLLRGLVCPILRLGTVLLDGICLGSRVRRPDAVPPARGPGRTWNTTTRPDRTPAVPVAAARVRRASEPRGCSAISTAPTRWLARNALMSATDAPVMAPVPRWACMAAPGGAVRPGGVTPKKPPASRNEKPARACQIICRSWRGSTIQTISPGRR